MKHDCSIKKQILTMSKHTFLYALSRAHNQAHEATIDGYYAHDDDGYLVKDILHELIQDGDVIQGEI